MQFKYDNPPLGCFGEIAVGATRTAFFCHQLIKKIQEFGFGSWQRLLNGRRHALLVQICSPDFTALTDICSEDRDKHSVVNERTLLVRGRGRVRGWRLLNATQSPHKDRSPALGASGSSPDQHHGQQSGSAEIALMEERQSLETNYSR